MSARVKNCQEKGRDENSETEGRGGAEAKGDDLSLLREEARK